MIFERGGHSHWPACSRKLGLPAKVAESKQACPRLVAAVELPTAGPDEARPVGKKKGPNTWGQ